MYTEDKSRRQKKRKSSKKGIKKEEKIVTTKFRYNFVQVHRGVKFEFKFKKRETVS